MLALNEKTYTLDSAMTVIADDSGVHDIAGIMGGEHSGVSEGTTDVLLEIAYFDPERIGATGRKLGLTFDARTRFERGVDPAFLDDGLELLTALILDICGGEASEVIRAGSPPSAPDSRRLRSGAGRKAGRRRDPGGRADGASSKRLGFDGRARTGSVTAPLRRHDIDGAADIVEEVVRIHGLDKVASVALPRADGVAAADRHARADARAPAAPRRRCARAQRGGDLVVHSRSRRRATSPKAMAGCGCSTTRSART